MALRSVQCEECGLVYTNPQPEPDDILRIYRGERVEGEWGEGYAKDQKSNEESLRRRFRERLDAMTGVGLRGGKLLDVGSQLGYFLDEARRRGFDARWGVELGVDLAKAARERFGVEVRTEPLEACGFDEATFDAITAFHVFEHVPDPGAFLDECLRILKPGGALVVEVPNRESRRARESIASGDPGRSLRPEKHLCDWAPKQLTNMLERHGFQAARSMTFEDARAGRALAKVSPGAQSAARSLGKRLPLLRVAYVAIKKRLAPGRDNLMAIGWKGGPAQARAAA